MIAAPLGRCLLDPETLARPRAQIRLVEAEPGASLARLYEVGVRAARAPWVALLESHSLPSEQWAGALLAAHGAGWDVVGSAMENGNPGSAVSWASFILMYGPWISIEAGPGDDLPGHHSSYGRELLLSHGPRLGALLESATALHRDLAGRGCRLYLEANARVAHVNPSRLGSFCRELFWYGRLFAGRRLPPAARLQRLLYAAGAVIVPLLRCRRVLPLYRQIGRRRRLPRLTWAALVLGLIASAGGEMAGYALGIGPALEQLRAIDERRLDLLRPQDRELLA